MSKRLVTWLTLACLFTAPQTGTAAPKDRVATAYRESYRHEVQAQYAAALVALDDLPASERTTYMYHLRRGWLLYLAGRHWDSIEMYRAAIKLEPDAIEPRLGLMLPLIAMRLWLDVIETGKGVTRRDSLNYLANSRMAWANYSLGRYAEAEQLYRKLLRAYPSDVQMRTGLAWSLLQQHRPRAAASQFRAVLRVAPDHESASAGLAAAESEP